MEFTNNQHVCGPTFEKRPLVNVKLWFDDTTNALRLKNYLSQSLEYACVEEPEQFSSNALHRLDGPVLVVSDHQHLPERFSSLSPEVRKNIISTLLFRPASEHVDGVDASTLYHVQDEQELIAIAQSKVQALLARRVEELMSAYNQQKKVLTEVQQQLAVFYHSISNPLTILSGNIQLLQLLSEGYALPAEIANSIRDLGGLTDRFEQDLQSIKAIREKLGVTSGV